MSGEQSKRFRLHVLGGAEQVPRLITAYGRACEGEFALVLRPREGRGLLVLMAEGQAAIWQASPKADAPRRPRESIPVAKVIPRVTAEKAEEGLPSPGPITLRGEWSGEMSCDAGEPVILLRRKLATYGTLAVQSDGERGWRWAFHRQTQWFTEHGSAEGDSEATLSGAIDAGIRQAMKMVAAACQVRDTGRRAAMDPAYAEKHPLKTRKPTKDPTSRFQPKETEEAAPKKRGRKPKAETGDTPAAEPKRGRRKAEEPTSTNGAPAPLHAPVPLPPVPGSAHELSRLVGEVAAEADALKALRGRAWASDDRQVPDKLVSWFKSHHLPDIAEELGALLFDLRTGQSREVASEVADYLTRLEDRALSKAVRDEAREKLLAVQRAAEREPMPMERARRLIRYAMRMIDSKLCQGAEREEAVAALQKAVNTYEEAREKLLLEAAPEVSAAELRRIAEAVSLSAAKVARSCGRGQQTLLKPRASKAAEPAPAAPPAKRRGRPRKQPEATEAANDTVDPAMDAKILDAIEDRIERIMARRRKSA